VKRRDLIRHLETHGCELLREGGRHTVYVNRKEGKVSTIPRHREINDPRREAGDGPSYGALNTERPCLSLLVN
jgi:hypothetical protein